MVDSQSKSSRFGGPFLFNLFFACCVVALIAYLYLGKLASHYWQTPVSAADEFGEQHSSSRTFRFVVKQGQSERQVITALVAQGFGDSVRVVSLLKRFNAANHKVKAGEYVLDHSMSLSKVFEVLNTGVSVQYRLQLIEGLNIAQMIDHLAQQIFDNPQLADMLVSVEDLSIESVRAEIVKALISIQPLESDLKIHQFDANMSPFEHTKLEGLFYADTYHISIGQDLESFFLRAHQQLHQRLVDLWQYRAKELPLEHPYQALIMASLIEKETGRASERNKISGVFTRRLQLNMRLQTDPTVVYALGSAYDGDIKRRDLKIASPYNTYVQKGLPPTPISLVGEAAIYAALNPDIGDALYFVAKGDGSHHFSATLEEHNKAVRNYQILNRRTDYRSSP